MSVAIMTDTNSGLTPEQAKELGVYLLPMPILIDGNAYYEHQSITPKEFYEKMRAKADISTTQPSPAEALELAEECQPDVVMTDIKMPYMDGLELSRRLQIEWSDCASLLVAG